MKKSDLLRVFGTLQCIGDVFAPVNEGTPLTKGAISQWEEDIPPLREYQIRELIPDIDTKIAASKRNAPRRETA